MSARDALHDDLVLGALYAGLAAATDRPAACLARRSEDNPLLVGLAMAREARADDGFDRLFDGFWDALADGDAETRLRRWRVEACRLFQGPPSPPAPPYEASHLAEGHPGACLRAVERAYRSVGASLSSAVRDRPDHAGAELEFLSALCRAGRGEPGTQLLSLDPDAARRARRAFLREHAGRWLPALADAVLEHARVDLFRVWGGVLHATLRWDRRRLASAVPVASPPGA